MSPTCTVCRVACNFVKLSMILNVVHVLCRVMAGTELKLGSLRGHSCLCNASVPLNH